jgi:alginate O-acetyltransferase complex protein AlgI
MTFNSLSYFLFLPVVYLVFHIIPDRWRGLLLLVASYGFYATFKAPYLLVVLFMVTAISYLCGQRIAASRVESIRKRWFWTGATACVAMLALRKYLPFLEAKTNSILGLSSSGTHTLITIGVSYFSFHAISYLADIYLEIEEPETNFKTYAVYMAFFPKLLQGPIERAGDLLPQLKQPYRFDYDTMRSGLLLFTWGLFKKVVVADRLALYADQVYNNVHDYTGLPLIIGTYFYALQLFFDFSGYTDMARGTGRIFGITLTENFNSPYRATSIADFWRRWHITFSRWILDYLFKPLQMSWRSWGQTGTAAALLCTFFLSGVWHGAGFVVWGLLHGIYLASSVYYRPYQKKLHKILGIEKSIWLKWWQMCITFNLVCFAWIFFRAGSAKGWYVVRNLFNGVTELQLDFLLSHGKIQLITTGVAILLAFQLKGMFTGEKFVKCTSARYFSYIMIISLIFLFGFSADKQFIYAEF